MCVDVYKYSLYSYFVRMHSCRRIFPNTEVWELTLGAVSVRFLHSLSRNVKLTVQSMHRVLVSRSRLNIIVTSRE